MNGIGGISQKGFTFSKEKTAIGKTSFANSAFNIQTENIGTVQSDVNGLLLGNPTLALTGLHQASPPIVLQGNGWSFSPTNASQDIRFRIDVLPSGAAGNPVGTLQIGSSINGAAYANRLTISSGGAVTIGSSLSASSIINISSITYATGFGNSILNVGGIISYKTTNGGSTLSPEVSFKGAFNQNTAGAKSIVLSNINSDLLGFVVGNGSTPILNAKIDLLNLVTTAGAEAGDLGFYTKPTGSAATLAFVIDKLGGISNTGSAAVNTYCELKAGTTAIAPLKITQGINMTSSAPGSIEYNGSHYETATNKARYGKGGVVADTYATVNNSTTTETSLWFYDSPIDFFKTLGDKCNIIMGGTILGHATNTRQIKVYFGGTAGTLIFNTGAMNVTTSADWKIEINLQMSASSKIKYIVDFTYNRSTPYISTGELSGTLTTTNKIELTGTGVLTGDISLYMGEALYFPASNP